MEIQIPITKEDLEQIKDFENEGGYPVEIIYVVIETDGPRMPPEEELMVAA
jgi:hypothetical protein